MYYAIYGVHVLYVFAGSMMRERWEKTERERETEVVHRKTQWLTVSLTLMHASGVEHGEK